MKLHRLIKSLFLGSVFTTILVLSFQAALWSQELTKSWSLPKVGNSAPDFSLQAFDGKSFILSEMKNNKAVLLWFTNLCSGCEKKLSEVEGFKNLFEKKGVEIAAVSLLGEDKKTVEDFIQKYRLSFRFLYDPDGKATERYSGKYVPDTCPLKNIYIISKEGKITYVSHLPGADESEIIEQLNKTIGEN